MAEYNINCDIARDLMPLVIDGVASPSAKEAVEAHAAGCEGCRKVMADMRRESALTNAEEDRGDTRFIQFCRRMEKGFRWRRLAAWLCGVIAVVAIANIGYYAIYNKTVPMKISESDMSGFRLVQDQSGNVSIEVTQTDPKRPLCGYEGYTEPASGSLRVYIAPTQFALSWFPGTRGAGDTVRMATELRLIDGRLFDVETDYVQIDETDENGETVQRSRLVEKSPTPVAELWLGKGAGAVLLYKDGDTLDLPVLYEEPDGLNG